MKPIIIISLVLPMTILSCNGQNTKNEKLSDRGIQPEEKISVTKEYDDKGNLIEYDSTYSYFYSDTSDSNSRNNNYSQFKSYFNKSYTFSNQPFFNNFFFPESLLMSDFYRKSFFYDRFIMNKAGMDSLFRQMDLMKNDYFENQIRKEKK